MENILEKKDNSKFGFWNMLLTGLGIGMFLLGYMSVEIQGITKSMFIGLGIVGLVIGLAPVVMALTEKTKAKENI